MVIVVEAYVNGQLRKILFLDELPPNSQLRLKLKKEIGYKRYDKLDLVIYDGQTVIRNTFNSRKKPHFCPIKLQYGLNPFCYSSGCDECPLKQ